jgi:hypothetical protein
MILWIFVIPWNWFIIGVALFAGYVVLAMIFGELIEGIARLIAAIVALHTRPKPPTPADRRFKLGAMSDEWDRQWRERE